MPPKFFGRHFVVNADQISTLSKRLNGQLPIMDNRPINEKF